MAKKDRFPDAYSGGFTSNFEPQGSGSYGRDDMDISGYENSSGTKTKSIKLSSALGDGFSVPIHVVPLSKLSSTDKSKLLLQLRVEVDKIRTFQKRADMDKASIVTMSSSGDILGRSNVQAGFRANLRRSLGAGERTDPLGLQARGAGTFSLVLKKQCENLLKKLMSHRHGWAFNKPVDAVALKIPDYFDVIKNPMDLGTIKEKLGSGKYSSPLDFLADVRLTFSNAMTYNPPGNDYHTMADILSKFFELRWKPIEKKFQLNGSQQQKVHEEIDLVKPMPSSKKRKITTIQQNPIPEPVKLVMTKEEKHNLSGELETHLDDLPDNIIEFLREHSSNGNETGEDEIEVDIDGLNDDALFKLRKMLDDHVKEEQNHAKVEPCVIELHNESGLSNSTMQLYKGNDLTDEELDIGGNDPLVSSYHPVETQKETNKKSNVQPSSGTLRDFDCSSASENQLNAVKTSSLLNLSKEVNVARADLEEKAGMSDLADNQSISELDQVDQISQQEPNSFESECQEEDGDISPNERQVLPEKLYRAAVLKKRFADTILKAREKTLNKGEKGDPDKQRREEELENQKKKEAKAAEDARRQAEAEAAVEAKRKRELEREAAREALLKMEKTVELDETSRFLEDLEILRTLNPEQLPSSADETSPDHMSQDGLGGFKFGCSNVLEQLGLYMKKDEEDSELEPPGGVIDDVEEGEIE